MLRKQVPLTPETFVVAILLELKYEGKCGATIRAQSGSEAFIYARPVAIVLIVHLETVEKHTAQSIMSSCTILRDDC
jgi:hypothetical protein